MIELLLSEDTPWRLDTLGEFVGLWVVLGILQFVVFWVALIVLLRSKHYTGGGKFLWFVVILFAPILGGIGYLALGRTAKIVNS